MKPLIFIDFETFYVRKEYTLQTLSVVEYVRSPRFKALGCGFATSDRNQAVQWITGSMLPSFFASVDWKNFAVVGHNIKFDGFILKEIYGVTPGQWIDTKGMSKAVLGKTVQGHSLAKLAEHFGLPSKGILKTDGLGEDGRLSLLQEKELAEYCLHDVELCRDIYERLAVDFPEDQYSVLHRTVDMFINPKLKLNVPLLRETSTAEAARRARIFDLIGIPKNQFASNIKFPQLLEKRGFEVPLKASPKKKNEDGTPKEIPAIALGDIEFLDMLESENEELRYLCEARVASKSTLLETRSAKLAAIGRTGLWPFDVEFSGADQTHRFSGGKGAGGNPQNFTRGSALRTAVEAPAGYELVVGDFSNIELRIVAYLSKDPGLVQAIEQGTDIYCDFASVFYGRRITRADKRERQFGKTAILGLGYGMGWRKFKRTVRLQTGETITDGEAQKAVELYRTRYGSVPVLWDALHNMIPTMVEPARTYMNLPVKFGDRFIQLPSGLKLRYPNLRLEQVTSKNEETGRSYTRKEWIYDIYDKGLCNKRKLYGGKVLENISQALAGELCKASMTMMGDAVIGQVHDELICLSKKGLGSVTAAKLKRAMSLSPSWLPQIKLDCEVGVGPNWNEAK